MSKFSDQHNNKQYISERFLKSMTVACLAGSLLHLFLSVFYFIIKVPEMFVYAIVTVFLFGLWRQLFKNKWIKLPFLLGSLNAITGIILANYFIGWDSNFNIYFIILPAALLLYTGWKTWERSLYLILIFCLFLFLYFILSDFDGIYNINGEILKYLSLMNTVSAVGIVIIILLLFNSSILEMQENLETKNLHLEQKTNELDRSLKQEKEQTLELINSDLKLRTLLLKEKELSLLKSNFIAMASHEFRTPLASIGAASDVIMRYFDKLSRDEINKRLEKIKSEVEYMTLMLEDMLIIGKSDSQKLDYNPDLLDLVGLIKEIISEHQLIESKNRTLIYDASSPVIMVKADKRWIKHIVINLFSNAVKYSDEDKQIEISIKEKPTGISFSFKDYGIGISKKDIKLLFEPFHRGNNVGEISGTGLGLAISQKAIDLHNGKIEVESEIGEGSRFTITLPID